MEAEGNKPVKGQTAVTENYDLALGEIKGKGRF